MAAARAVVACAEEDTEIAVLLREASAGICVEPESVVALNEAIRALRTDPARSAHLGASGRKWIEDHYSSASVVRAYDRMVCDVAAGDNDETSL
jgi:glycosyltransferase involved in cell wall biosynthesis